MKNFTVFIRWSLILMATSVCFCSIAAAQEMPVPAKIQVAIYKKIFPMISSISGDAKVLVAYAGASAGLKDDIVKQFADAGIEAKAVEAGAVGGAISGYNVVYIAPGATGVKSACNSSKVISISGVPEYAEKGDATVSIGTNAGKPQIIINTSSAKSEDAKISSQLLKLAKAVD